MVYSIEFLNYDLGYLKGGTVIEVTLSAMANVCLLDTTNFNRYQNGFDFRCQAGGLARSSPCRITVPYGGAWHVTVDLACGGSCVRSSVAVINPKSRGEGTTWTSR